MDGNETDLKCYKQIVRGNYKTSVTFFLDQDSLTGNTAGYFPISAFPVKDPSETANDLPTTDHCVINSHTLRKMFCVAIRDNFLCSVSIFFHIFFSIKYIKLQFFVISRFD